MGLKVVKSREASLSVGEILIDLGFGNKLRYRQDPFFRPRRRDGERCDGNRNASQVVYQKQLRSFY